VSEWALPIEVAQEALEGLRDIIDRGKFKANFPVEIRFTAGDDSLLSPATGRDTVWIGILSFKPYGVSDPQKQAFFGAFQSLCVRLGGRPHWAKTFSLQPGELADLYPTGAWKTFSALRSSLDSTGVFLNSWGRRLFF